MIGQFCFADDPPVESVRIKLEAADGGAVAHIALSTGTIELLKRHNYPIINGEEAMQLPFALGYGVVVSALTHSFLFITGDKTAWPVEWGHLLGRH